MSTEPSRIVCAALRRKDTGGIICGPRHFDPIMRGQIFVTGQPQWKVAEQGFVDAMGKFLTREEALIVALETGQRIKRCGGDDNKLFSENLY